MRNYTEISKDKFLKEVKVIMDHEEYPYVLPKKISKDISKVSFDFENYTDFNEKYGYSFLSYLVPFFFVNSQPGYLLKTILCALLVIFSLP